MEHTSLPQRLTVRLPSIVFVLCLVQPCMDVLSYWMEQTGMSSITLLLRMGMLSVTVALGVILTQRRRCYWALLSVLAVFTLCHGAVCAWSGYLAPAADLTNLVRIYQLPLTTLSFITFLQREPKCLQAIRQGFFGCLAIVIAVELLSVVTGTDPHTYAAKGLGVLGWFYTPSAQSAILTMLVPVVVAFVVERKGYRPGWTLGASLVSLGVLYCFGTRLAYAALLGTGLGLALSLLILKGTRRLPTLCAAAALLACTALALGTVTLSPMYENDRQKGDNLLLKQEDIDRMVAEDDAQAVRAGLAEEERRTARLRTAYEVYLAGPTERFGLERTAEFYGYSTDAGLVADDRVEKLNYCRMLLEDEPQCRFFGLELRKMVCGGAVYDVENDFHGIYYLCGGVGLAMLLLFLGWFVMRIVRALIRDFKGYFTLEAAGFGIALICCLAHGYFTAGVLRRPNATFYLAVILAAVYALTRVDREKNDTR